MRKPIYEQYLNIVMTMDEIEDKNNFVKELVRRHREHRRISDSTYSRCKNILYYKESLGRNSPYYVDLLKIENIEDQKVVLKDIHSSIKY